MVRSFAVLLGLSCGALFAAPVPRQAPEFVINLTPSKQALLSSYKGKVVLLEIISTTCSHCQQTSQMVAKLNTELGPKGFQPLAAAVNPMAIMLVKDFVKDFQINFPVGATERDPALSFLQINGADRWVVPQMVLIDQKGVIRMQTPPQGDEKMQSEQFLRTQILELLKEGGKGKRPEASTHSGSKKKAT